MLLAFLLMSPVLFFCLCALHWRRKARQSASRAEGMALLSANLEGQLSESQRHNETYRELAREAIRESAKAVKLNPDQVLPRFTVKAAPYIAPEVKFCKCNVSVRSETWPVACPACGQMIDSDILDADLLE